jgi:Zn-dependent membrane protease YugP
MKMDKKHLKVMEAFNALAAYGGGSGFIFLLFGIFVHTRESGYLLISMGIGFMAASVVMLLMGAFIGLMEEYTINSKEKPEISETPKRNYHKSKIKKGDVPMLTLITGTRNEP